MYNYEYARRCSAATTPPNVQAQRICPRFPGAALRPYELRHLLGSHTGLTVDRRRGEALPPAPRGWLWTQPIRLSEGDIDKA